MVSALPISILQFSLEDRIISNVPAIYKACTYATREVTIPMSTPSYNLPPKDNPLLKLAIVQWRTIIPRPSQLITPPDANYWYQAPKWDPSPILQQLCHQLVPVVIPSLDASEFLETEFLGNFRRLQIRPNSATNHIYRDSLTQGVRIVIGGCELSWISYYIFGIRMMTEHTAYVDVKAVERSGTVYDQVKGSWAPFTLECPLDMVRSDCRLMELPLVRAKCM